MTKKKLTKGRLEAAIIEMFKEISEEIDQEKLMKAVNSCPVKAISISADEN